MGTDWTTSPDFTAVEQQLWASSIQSSTATTDQKIAGEAPENIHLTFEELDILPEQIQGDQFYQGWSNWTKDVPGPGGWNTVFSGGTTEIDDDGVTR